jgi:NAD dependent epimerase/dehydratase
MVDKMNWRVKKIVVTGAGGFIGSHLVERLLALGADVTAFLRYNSRNDMGLLSLLKEKTPDIRTVSGDIRDLETVRILTRGADVIFHLAAHVGIPYSYLHASEVVEVNTIGTLNVLTAAKENKIPKILVTSTSEVYGTALYVPMDEKHPRQPQSPYSASKIAADAIARSYFCSFDLPVAIVRPFNTYGPRQSDRAIIPTIISQALTKREVILGNSKPTRDFTYVTDTVEGFIKVAESDKSVGQEINLGTGREISVGDLAHKIAGIIGCEVSIRQSAERVRPGKSEVERLLSDNSRAVKLLGWEPKVDLDRGLRLTADWIRTRLNLYSPETYRI